MVIFNKYENSFSYKVLKLKNFNSCVFFINCDYKNNPIHNALIYACFSLYFLNYFNLKNRFKKYFLFNIKYLNYFNLKITQTSIFNN